MLPPQPDARAPLASRQRGFTWCSCLWIPQVHVKVTRLIEVNAPNYFEVDSLISISWEDPRITVKCTGILPGEAATDTICDLNWKPTVSRPGRVTRGIFVPGAWSFLVCVRDHDSVGVWTLPQIEFPNALANDDEPVISDTTTSLFPGSQTVPTSFNPVVPHTQRQVLRISA